MSENIEDLKAQLAAAEAAAKAAEAEAARAKAEALRLQLEAKGSSAAEAPAATAEAETQQAEAARATADALRTQVEAAEAAPEAPTAEAAPAAEAPAAQAAPASSPAPSGELSAFATQIQGAYSWEVPAVTIGTLIDGGARVPGVSAKMPLPMFNRHLLVAGATGTGKTRTLQLLAEGLSANGSSVLLCDVKGDLTGLAEPDASSEKLLSRTAANGQDWASSQFPIELLSLGGADSQFPGVPVRAQISDFGPILLARALSLNTTQEQALQLIFAWADAQGLELIDLPDLRAVISFLTSDEGKDELATIGGVSKATAGVILRALTALESQGGGQFFGAPGFDTADLMRMDSTGRGIISLLGVGDISSRPALVSAVIMFLLANLFSTLPEVLLRRGTPAVCGRHQGVRASGRPDRSPYPFQGRGCRLRNADPQGHPLRRPRPARFAHPARPACLHAGRLQEAQGHGPDLPEDVPRTRRGPHHPGHRRGRRDRPGSEG